MKKNFLIILTLGALVFTSCGTTTKDKTTNVSSETQSTNVSTETQTSSVTEKIEKETSTITETKPSETSTESEKTEDISNIKISDSLKNGSELYHLVNDIKNNLDSSTTQDSGITYMFSKDNSGKRDGKSLYALYTSVSGMDKNNMETSIQSFISSHYQELVPYDSNLKLIENSQQNTYALTFSDLKFTFFVDKENRINVVIGNPA